jgi:hypothetical protein
MRGAYNIGFEIYETGSSIEAQIEMTGYVSDEELIWLYRNFYVNLYLSLFKAWVYTPLSCKLEGVNKNYTSKKFAHGWRRFMDWPDWMTPAGWHHEHDVLHHYSLGEKKDPNNAQHNMEWLDSQVCRCGNAM